MIKQTLILLFFILLEPVKRILSALLYLFIYPFRESVRDMFAVMWLEYLYRTTFKPLWFFLDDSIEMEQGIEYDDKEKRYPALLWKWHKDFLLSWWWSAIRNSCVNWNNYCAYKLGDYICKNKVCGSVNSFVEMKSFNNGNRLYTEFFIGKFWFQFGVITRGRFEIDVFKTNRKRK